MPLNVWKRAAATAPQNLSAIYTDLAMQGQIGAATAAPPKRRRIELARRTCVIDRDRIAIRPSPAALVPPLFGAGVGFASFGLIMADVVFWRGALPLALLALLLFAALICIPLSGMGLVYGAIGANVLIDRAKQSATWQQGLLGLGVGTTELVPFWKIEAIVVQEAGAEAGRSTEEFAQWEIALCKKSGGQLTIGRLSSVRSLAKPSLERAIEVAEAVAALTGAPLKVPRQGDAGESASEASSAGGHERIVPGAGAEAGVGDQL